MPELPDVELARRDLHAWLEGAVITEARCDDRYLLRPGSPRAFGERLRGRRVEAVERKGKWLKLTLEGEVRLFSHLGMTGDWARVAPRTGPLRFERARLEVKRGAIASSVRYTDSRRFGRLITSRHDIADWTSLGPDPLAEGIDRDRLARALESRRRVKELLMDQTILAGIGNILATEALWSARVDPRARGGSLRPEDVRAIGQALLRTIAREIGDRTRGKPDAFFVYGRAKKPCPRCGTVVRSVVIAGRTSAFCPGCQVLRSAAGRPLPVTSRSSRSSPRRRRARSSAER